jgi:hypothetical protein
MQLNANEVHSIKSAEGLQDIRLSYQPMWVLTRIADMDRPKDGAKEELHGGWKLSARILDHAVGKADVGMRIEVPGMIPKGIVKSQINKVWEQMLFCVQNDTVTWQSWLMRVALGLPKAI